MGPAGAAATRAGCSGTGARPACLRPCALPRGGSVSTTSLDVDLSSESLARRQSSDGRNWLPAGRPRCAGRGGRGATSASRQRGAGTEHGARPCGGGGRRAAWAPALAASAVPLNQTEPGPVASQDPSGCRGSAGENRDQSRCLEPFLGGERDAAQSLVPGAAAHGRSALA